MLVKHGNSVATPFWVVQIGRDLCAKKPTRARAGTRAGAFRLDVGRFGLVSAHHCSSFFPFLFLPGLGNL
jgi:hypothetical protein